MTQVKLELNELYNAAVDGLLLEPLVRTQDDPAAFAALLAFHAVYGPELTLETFCGMALGKGSWPSNMQHAEWPSNTQHAERLKAALTVVIGSDEWEALAERVKCWNVG